MKLTNKRFWNGEKTIYYPSFKYALTDSLLFSVLWVGIICLWLSAICLIIHLTNGSNFSWDIISAILLFLSVVFFISNGMFLYENWYKQKRIIGKIKKLLPEGYCVQNIDFNAENKKYTIQVNYMGRTFRITVVYPVLCIKEKNHAATVINIYSKNYLEKWKSVILNHMTVGDYNC